MTPMRTYMGAMSVYIGLLQFCMHPMSIHMPHL
jgi:hypothetical protein